MIDPLSASLKISGSGLHAQSQRMRVVSENLANANSTADVEGANPYRRKTITFHSEMDRLLGADLVAVKGVGTDRSDFKVEYDPSHPAADKDGNVKLPNVNMLVELADMRETTRSYEAGLQVMKQTSAMINRTIDLLRSR
ncbi:flagellar basal body rod protein FlgC [Flexibacterium corallicola]|uniref:flagellar basal body rod protein FlgC n=1 Tax=Flexibacterium corallicola TaxID=3037259 RepID=UPI00286F60C4|nr:flagellar basal body rod protein FlgC [Pseudovibrio sp. M1P-2-3]